MATPNALRGRTFLVANPQARADDLHWALESEDIRGMVSIFGWDDRVRLLPLLRPEVIRALIEPPTPFELAAAPELTQVSPDWADGASSALPRSSGLFSGWVWIQGGASGQGRLRQGARRAERRHARLLWRGPGPSQLPLGAQVRLDPPAWGA